MLGCEVAVRVQVVYSVQPLGLDSPHSVLMRVLRQDSHVWVPESCGSFLG